MRAVTARITHSNGTEITIGRQTQTLAYNIAKTWDGRNIRTSNARAFVGWRNLGARLEARLVSVLAELQRSECRRLGLHGF
jgi:hypothetical protein